MQQLSHCPYQECHLLNKANDPQNKKAILRSFFLFLSENVAITTEVSPWSGTTGTSVVQVSKEWYMNQLTGWLLFLKTFLLIVDLERNIILKI